MTRHFTILSLLLISILPRLSASDHIFIIGANNTAMGNATVMRYDLWSAFHNQAGLAHLQTMNAGFYYESRFTMKELGMQAFTFALPTSTGTFAASFANYGYSKYFEQQAGLAYAKAFGDKFSAGIQFDYLRTFIAEYDEKSNFTFELGIISEPIDNLFIGAHVYNPIITSLTSDGYDKIPTILRIGVGYNINDKAFLCLETEKDIDEKTSIKVGLEWKLIENLMLRGGIGNNPLNSSFGIGYRHKKLTTDIAFTYHPILGATPHIGISYGL